MIHYRNIVVALMYAALCLFFLACTIGLLQWSPEGDTNSFPWAHTLLLAYGALLTIASLVCLYDEVKYWRVFR